MEELFDLGGLRQVVARVLERQMNGCDNLVVAQLPNMELVDVLNHRAPSVLFSCNKKSESTTMPGISSNFCVIAPTSTPSGIPCKRRRLVW